MAKLPARTGGRNSGITTLPVPFWRTYLAPTPPPPRPYRHRPAWRTYTFALVEPSTPRTRLPAFHYSTPAPDVATLLLPPPAPFPHVLPTPPTSVNSFCALNRDVAHRRTHSAPSRQFTCWRFGGRCFLDLQCDILQCCLTKQCGWPCLPGGYRPSSVLLGRADSPSISYFLPLVRIPLPVLEPAGRVNYRCHYRLPRYRHHS